MYRISSRSSYRGMVSNFIDELGSGRIVDNSAEHIAKVNAKLKAEENYVPEPLEISWPDMLLALKIIVSVLIFFLIFDYLVF